MLILPAEFINRMQSLPGFDLAQFMFYLNEPAFRGLRVNKLKCSPENFEQLSPFALKKSPFCDTGFYVGTDVSGRHPWHHAGLFYIQEPSAMSAVTALDVRPGMKVLDLCAAPGGKTTQAAAALMGSGLLVCNEIVPSRAAILLSNIERCGVRNAAVTSEKPEKLCARLEGFFDRVLVDAPCSGEGMFRREPAALREWTPESSTACAKRQLAILETACQAVVLGGILVYSTCTFSPEENEGVVDTFLTLHKDFVIEPIETTFGRPAVPEWAGASPELNLARRVFPADGGEGHFVAKLRRISDGKSYVTSFAYKTADKEPSKLFNDFYASQFGEVLYGELFQLGEKLLIMPQGMPDLRGIGLLRAGVYAGDVKGSRFEPSHALYMAAEAAHTVSAVDFALSDPRLAAYLHGEQVEAPDNKVKGYACVKAEGFTIGFGKVSDGALKNHYPKGLRNVKTVYE